jgi:hypothetical protein
MQSKKLNNTVERYNPPKLTVHGPVEQITQMNTIGGSFDQPFNAGDPVPPNPFSG